MIAMEASDLRTRNGLAVLSNRHADESVELGDGTLGGVDDFGLILEELDHHEPGVFVNEEGGVSISTE